MAVSYAEQLNLPAQYLNSPASERSVCGTAKESNLPRSAANAA